MKDVTTLEGSAEASRDSALLLSIQQRDQTAMTQVFQLYSRLVYSVALRVLQHPEQAEDVLQDVFMQIWKKPVTLDQGRGSFGSLLAVMARNRSIDVLRRRKPTQSTDDFDMPSSFSLSNDSERRLLLDRVRVLANELPSEQQMVLQLAFFEGLTHAEIAVRTGAPLGTVKTRIRSAVQALERSLTA